MHDKQVRLLAPGRGGGGFPPYLQLRDARALGLTAPDAQQDWDQLSLESFGTADAGSVSLEPEALGLPLLSRTISSPDLGVRGRSRRDQKYARSISLGADVSGAEGGANVSTARVPHVTAGVTTDDLTLFGSGDHDANAGAGPGEGPRGGWDELVVLGGRAVYLMLAFLPFFLFGPPLLTVAALMTRNGAAQSRGGSVGGGVGHTSLDRRLDEEGKQIERDLDEHEAPRDWGTRLKLLAWAFLVVGECRRGEAG